MTVAGRIYNPKHAVVGEPVPFKRQSEIATEAAFRWWDLYTRSRNPYAIFDADAALADVARTLADLARLESAVGEDRVRAWIAAALEKHCPEPKNTET